MSHGPLIPEFSTWLDAADVEYQETAPNHFVVVLPGTAKLKTTVSLSLGPQALSVNAFVCRKPDENMEIVHRWLLRQNPRLFGIAFALDRLGDIYLVGRIPVRGLDPEVIDLLLGAILQASDESFNTLISMGFASAIRRERAWRESRGESLANLAAFSTEH